MVKSPTKPDCEGGQGGRGAMRVPGGRGESCAAVWAGLQEYEQGGVRGEVVSRTGAGPAGRLAGIKAQIAQFCRRPWTGKKREGAAGGGAEGAAAAGGVSSCPDPGRRSGPVCSLGAVGARIRSAQRTDILSPLYTVTVCSGAPAAWPTWRTPRRRAGGRWRGWGPASVVRSY